MTGLRPARQADAALLARLSDMADEGLPRLFWQNDARPDHDIWAVGRDSFLRLLETDPPGQMLLTDSGLAPTGGVWTYPMTDPGDPEAGDIPDLAPLRRLKAHVSGQWYIDFLAVLPEHRGRGLGRRLLTGALDAARSAGAARIGLIALDSNATAQALYTTAGFVTVASEPLLNDRWKTGARMAQLMTRAL
ncbi:MAG: hypothetical protein CML68_19155 [Rhodobacteraceae bacterium]|nr:hypothetical protein [Paracoccaceae bacterium]